MVDTVALTELAEHISMRRANDVVSTEVAFGELTVNATPSGLVGLIEFLRNDANCRFSTLIDITAVDNPQRPARFDIVYHLLSMYQNQRIRVKAQIREDEIVPSLTGVFPGANWYEREIFDMFGILFSGHPDLRRILTDYGFRGHPLRKDFPTTGYVEVRWNDDEKRVVYEPVSLVQEYRQFDFLSPWEGAKYVLPGDEKAPEAKK
ncbi:NADH-quinone oxidoreductase subunit C [Paracoccus aestuariivivens]|uniref:NADH-quinone oxidoreductase subunit C n=1 Tax=Paracoccus aestuariivivens TaxID=1820333 RepID=A0A6L6J3X4_9RHOB|nr:NADH-quinone oxidoreductase subunit C [Paracoccus aestuariivivens]MTH76266.1 NADH-quinone oxidoreductase subunit C [Paracoccus aestuariivivens]